ncbi:MAG: class I SAM-dependent methyltransferase [Anaerolineales bacterium]|jgi:ubiquinone/menaquinone biosynthesis C-methylase UbiE
MNPQPPPVCDYNGSDYQTSFWEKGGRDYEDQVEAVALQRLLPKAGNILLEVGAGAGRNTPRYQGYDRLVLLDYSLTQLQQARARLGASSRFTYVAGNVYNLPFAAGLFDCATMIRTLHHMSDAPQALAQIRRVLQPGATFILEYANKYNLKAILRYLLRQQSWSPFTLEPVEFTALNFDFHPKSIRTWLLENGFSIERQLTVSHFRMRLLKRIIPVKLLVKMDSLAQLTGNLWQLTPSVFLRAQAQGHTPIAAQGHFFRCPQCNGIELTKLPEKLICTTCSREWLICDGIYNFRD